MGCAIWTYGARVFISAVSFISPYTLTYMIPSQSQRDVRNLSQATGLEYDGAALKRDLLLASCQWECSGHGRGRGDRNSKFTQEAQRADISSWAPGAFISGQGFKGKILWAEGTWNRTDHCTLSWDWSWVIGHSGGSHWIQRSPPPLALETNTFCILLLKGKTGQSWLPREMVWSSSVPL